MALAIYAAAVWTTVGQRIDSDLMGAGLGLTSVLGLNMILVAVVRNLTLAVLIVVTLVQLVKLAIAKRWWFVTRAMVLVAVSYVVARLLRDTLPRPDYGDPVYPYNTWPSAHAATTTALVLILAGMSVGKSPRRVRRVLLAVMVSVSALSVAAMAHRPSDVLGSVLLVAALSVPVFRGGLPQGLAGDTLPPPWIRLAVVLAGAVALTGAWISVRSVYLGICVNAAWIFWVCDAAMTIAGLRPGWNALVLRSGREPGR